MRLIALKPCKFSGKSFLIGDEIPTDLISNPKVQEKMGVIAIARDVNPIPFTDPQEYVAQVGVIQFEIPIHSNDGDLPLRITNEELTIFTDIRQIDVNKTEDKQKISNLIQKVESEDLLIMLDALDGRKFVKEEAQARAKVLNNSNEKVAEEEATEVEEGEQTGGDE